MRALDRVVLLAFGAFMAATGIVTVDAVALSSARFISRETGL